MQPQEREFHYDFLGGGALQKQILIKPILLKLVIKKECRWEEIFIELMKKEHHHSW